MAKSRMGAINCLLPTVIETAQPMVTRVPPTRPCLQRLVQVPELVGISHHVDRRHHPIVDLKSGRLQFAISFSGHEARQAVDQGGADQG